MADEQKAVPFRLSPEQAAAAASATKLLCRTIKIICPTPAEALSALAGTVADIIVNHGPAEHQTFNRDSFIRLMDKVIAVKKAARE